MGRPDDCRPPRPERRAAWPTTLIRGCLVYEPRHHRPIPHRHFLRRVATHLAAAGGIVVGSLLVGMAGYAYFEGLHWRDAFLNAAMLLGGMGPIDAPRSPGGKLFAGVYALYAGLVFLVGIAVVLAPVVHRVLHTFHWEEQQP
jgi:hypothetical protein